jgi:hypothetical protein
VIDHGGRTDNPGITLAGFQVASPLGAEYGSFFLSFAEEHHAFRLAEMPVLFGHNIIHALSLLKLNQGHRMVRVLLYGYCIASRGLRFHPFPR